MNADRSAAHTPRDSARRSPARSRGTAPAAALLLALAAAAAAAGGRAELSAADGPPGMLRLAGDDFLAGELLASTDPGTVRWQSPAFVQPFELALGAVKSIDFAAGAATATPRGEYCFELAGGDVLFGSLVSLDAGGLEADVDRAGRVRLRRDMLQSLYRWNVAELVYLGPNGAAGWKEPAGARDWREEAGHLLTRSPGAALLGELGIPSRSIVEAELSWSVLPDFTLALGAASTGAGDHPFRVEVWWRPQPVTMLVSDARTGEPPRWQYTLRDPGDGWTEPGFDDGGWRSGPAGFGTDGTPGAIVRTEWDTREIWLRRRFHADGERRGLALSLHHDEDARVWINGKLVCDRKGFISTYATVPLDAGAELLRAGENTIAVHCRQTGGGQYIDVGILDTTANRSGDLVAVRETDQGADVARLAEVTAGPGRLHLLLHVDQEAGRMLILTPEGTQVADLQVAPSAARPAGGIVLQNHDGDLRLERLRVSRWNGAAPRPADAGKPLVRRTDGSVTYGELAAIDSAAGELVLRAGGVEERVPMAEVAAVMLAPVATAPPRAVRAVYADGTQLSGEVAAIAADQFELSSPGVLGPLRLPVAGLRSLVVLRPSETPPPALAGGPAGRLQTDGALLHGRLTDGREAPPASCLVWQPTHSSTASALRAGSAATITYRQPAPPAARSSRSAPEPEPEKGALRKLLAAFAGEEESRPRTGPRSLHLRAGDKVPCTVTRIDEHGVSFSTPVSSSAFVAHDKVKAVELGKGDGPPRLSKAKRERLLMLPRMQTPSPPTHLVRSHNGDFLRGNLISLDGKVARIEVRSEVKEIERTLISHIIWLHADELPPAPAVAAPAALAPPAPAPAASPAPHPQPAPDLPGTLAPTTPPGARNRVLVRQTGGNRLTLVPTAVQSGILSGTSDVLGACRIELAQVDQLLAGEAVDPGGMDLPYHAWKLHRAIDPIYIQALEDPRRAAPTPGIDSPLVGKPAPDFELELLDGKKYRLSNSRGRVVVLDFWATWCGPCLQSLPRLEQTVRDLDDPRVELLAVNLEEPASRISATLERHKLAIPVALDRDGVVAGKYEARAIPQTVIVDREGKLVRLFIGGSPQVADQVRDAVRGLLPPPEEPR